MRVLKRGGGRRARWMPLALSLFSLVCWLSLAAPGWARPRQSEATSVHYAAGWNIVAAPTATELAGTAGPQYAFGADGTGYVSVHPGEIVGGRAVWAFFPQDVDEAFGGTAATFTRVLVPAGQWVLIGNPSTSLTLPITGADQALAYDPAQGYVAVTSLKPGQGAWVLSAAGGDVTVGTPPSDPQAQRVQQIQGEMVANPTDRANFDQLAGVAGELVQNHQYDRVQEAMDDLRAAFEDGLRSQGAAPLTEMTAVQVQSARTIRGDLVEAQSAVARGDYPAADAAIAEAVAAARRAEDDAVSESGGQPGSSNAAYFGRRQSSGTPNSLAAFGAIVRTAFFG